MFAVFERYDLAESSDERPTYAAIGRATWASRRRP